MSLPQVAASVTADAVANLPVRLKAKLDAAVAAVPGWALGRDGDRVTVSPDERTTVTLANPVTDPADATCTCLLAPRCLHRTAALSAAPILTLASPAPTTASSDPATAGPADLPSAVPTAAHLDAADALRAAAATILSGGLPGAGAVAQADLLRAVHQARAAGLHTPSAAAVAVVEHLRSARRDDPSFRLKALTDDLRDLLATCHRVTSGDPAAAGVARRDYEPVGDLRLYGLFCEPVRPATGHAGIATYLADRQGRLWSVSDVKSTGLDLPVAGHHTAAELGEVRLSHHDLSRAGLQAINAHASAAGRLSHGKARRAIAAPGAGWFDPELDPLWQTDLPAQADRWLAAEALPAHERPTTAALAFLDGTILGPARAGLLLRLTSPDQTTAGPTVTVIAPLEDPSLPYVTNLRLLATHAAGRPVRMIARFAGPRRVAALAIAWQRPESGHADRDHTDLGTTLLNRADIPATRNALPTATADGPAPPPLHLIRHQLERVVSAGRSVLLPGVTDDARRLTAAHLTAGATVITALGAAGTRRTRDVFGRLDPHDDELLARAWLTAAAYENAATRESTRTAWAGPQAAGTG